VRRPRRRVGRRRVRTPGEIALARKLVKFADAVRLATETLSPHFLCLYLYELAGEFSTFYNADKVIVDEPPVRARSACSCARARSSSSRPASTSSGCARSSGCEQNALAARPAPRPP
jgi:hypothetical protein